MISSEKARWPAGVALHYGFLAWNTRLCSGERGVAYLQIVQSRREGAAVRQPEVFLRKYMAGKPARLDVGVHIISQYINKINRVIEKRGTTFSRLLPIAHNHINTLRLARMLQLSKIRMTELLV